MKKLSDGTNHPFLPPANYLFIFIYFSLLLVIIFKTYPDLKKKSIYQKDDNVIGLMFDFDDLEAFLPNSQERIKYLEFNKGLFRFAAVREKISDEWISVLRDKNITPVWKIDNDSSDELFLQVRRNDGVWITGENIIDKPAFPQKIKKSILSNDGFMVVMDFTPIKNYRPMINWLSDHLIKGHILNSRELLNNKRDLWLQRVARAAKTRWVRLICLRFSSALTIEENIQFHIQVKTILEANGFLVDRPLVFKNWPAGRAQYRLWLSYFILILTPVVVLISTLKLVKVFHVFWAFSMACLLSTMGGIAIQSLCSHPDIVLGLAPIRGIKIHLLFPILLGGFVLLKKQELKSWLNSPVHWRHVLWGGFLLVFIGGLYLLRSGNYSLIPVSDSERKWRDILETLLVARPRFKEFLLAHPLFILGLWLYKNPNALKIISWDNRFFLLVGLIGQVSILNTFTHVYTPLNLGVIRTFHAAWMGGLVFVFIWSGIKFLSKNNKPGLT